MSSLETSLGVSVAPVDASTARRVRQQAAVVRALLDELDRLMPCDASANIATQVDEELAALADAMRTVTRRAA